MTMTYKISEVIREQIDQQRFVNGAEKNRAGILFEKYTRPK